MEPSIPAVEAPDAPAELAEDPAAASATPALEDAFPAGLAVALHTAWFLLVRLAGQLTRSVHWLATVASLLGAAAILLSAVVLVRLASRAVGENRGPLRVWAAARAAALLLPATLLGASLYSEASPRLQAAALWSALLALWLTLGVAAARMIRRPGAALALLLLLVGQTLELLYAPLFYSSVPGSSLQHGLLRLGAAAELCAFLGALLALGWSLASTFRAVGRRSALRFLVPPGLMVSLVSVSIPFTGPRAWSILGRAAFGLRGDLVFLLNPSTRPVVQALFGLLYALTPAALLVSITTSLAALHRDEGAAGLRAMGWLFTLLAGFSALRVGVSPVDPVRMLMVLAGSLLLERATRLEKPRLAP